MKNLLTVLVLALSLSGCNITHSIMDSAYVGTVDGKSIVMRKADIVRNGQVMYRPQFQTDCPYNLMYVTDSTSTNCYIRESRITDLRKYRDHVTGDSERKVGTTIGYVAELPEVTGDY